MTPYHTSERAIFYNGDCRSVMAEMEDNSFDSIVCDPPYELSNDGKASPSGVLLEFMFPKYANVDPSASSESKLPFLIDKVFGLTRSSIVPTPSSSMPIGSVTFDDDVSVRDENVIDTEECPVGISDGEGVNDKKSKPAEYIGCFYLELTDTAAFFNALNSAGAGFFAGGIGVGFGIESASFPTTLADGRVVRGSDTNIGNIDDSLSNLVGALLGTAGNPVFSFGLRRGSVEKFSTHSACVFFSILQLTGAKIVAALPAAGGLSPKLETRRISVVDGTTDRALSFDLIVHPQEISSKGFMGKDWDGSKIAYDVAMWQEALRVLKPGGHLLAFGGSRTYHRLACAIEDAGFEIRDQIMWVYGSGFPKSLDVSKAIDKAAGATREVVGYDASRARPNRQYEAGAIGNIGGAGKISDRSDNGATITAPATDDASKWEGWGTALKPAHEPIVVARKPLVGTVAANVLKHGTGALNIGACRIEGEPVPINRLEQWSGFGQEKRPEYEQEINNLGRWPANLITSYNKDEYILNKGISQDQSKRLFEWLYEDSQR